MTYNKEQFEKALAEARKLDNKNIKADLDNLSTDTVESVCFKVQHEIDMIDEGEYDLDGINRRSQNAYRKNAMAFLEEWSAVKDEEAFAKMNEEQNEENEEVSGEAVIDMFLAEWKNSAREYYTNLRNEYVKHRDTLPEITAEGLAKVNKGRFDPYPKYSDDKIKEIIENLPTMTAIRKREMRYEIQYFIFHKWQNEHTKVDMAIVEDAINAERLENLLDGEVERKKKSLIKRIEKKAGKIVDVKQLRFGNDGELNGYVTGEKATVHVQTIFAGGYNIQRLHFRVLVNIVK